MPYFSFKNIKISGISTAVPKQEIDVSSFSQIFGDDFVTDFETVTGIRKFRRSSEKQTASDLGYEAANRLLETKGISKDKIGALLFASHSPDYKRPATACVLHKRLELPEECAALDMNLGCSAFVYGLVSACSLMQCSDIDRALLVVAETVSKNVYPKDRSVAAMFGDAGSAILLEKNESSSIQGLLRTDGKRYRAIIMPAGGSRNPFPSSEPMLWPDGNERTLFNNYMNGMDVFNFTITEVPLAIKDFFSHTDTDVSDYDSFVLHQANLFISKQIARKLRIPTEKMPISLDRFGNTSAPSIPLTLCDAYCNSTEGVLRTLMCGYGVGLSWGVVSAPIDTEDILPVFDTDEYFAEGFINSPEDL